MWNSVSVAVTVVVPPAPAAVPVAAVDGEDADDDWSAVGEVTDGEPAADDELDEQAASRLTVATAAGIANQAAPRRSRRLRVFFSAESTILSLLAAGGRIASIGTLVIRNRAAIGLA